MKMRVYALIALLIGIFTHTKAQEVSNGPLGLKPRLIYVSDNKTTNLVFPSGIKSFDRGKRELLAQKAAEVENVLQVKFEGRVEQETNLTVYTADGSLYSFEVRYGLNPGTLNLVLPPLASDIGQRLLFAGGNEDAGAISRNSELAAMQRPFLSRPGKRKNQMSMDLCGIYVKGDNLYFQFRLENQSNLDFTIEQLRLYIRDRKQSKRTSSQEVDLVPVSVSGNVSVVAGRKEQIVVLVVPRFTIPDQKLLWVQLLEGNGGRHLSFPVKNRTLLKVRPVGINW